MDTLIRRLASPPATSTSTLAITWLFVNGTASNIFFTATNATPMDLAISAALSAVVFGALALCRALIRHLGDYRVRASGILTVVIGANLFRILTLDELLQQIEVSGTRTLFTRLASAVFITLLGCSSWARSPPVVSDSTPLSQPSPPGPRIYPSR